MDSTLLLILGVVIAIGVFMLIRSLLLWYWGITEIIDNQKKQNHLLQRIIDGQPSLASTTSEEKARLYDLQQKADLETTKNSERP